MISELGADLENEIEDEGTICNNLEIFDHDIKEGLKKFEKKSKYKYDEKGIEITPFNMTDELEEGYIDDSGCYVYNKRGEE